MKKNFKMLTGRNLRQSVAICGITRALHPGSPAGYAALMDKANKSSLILMRPSITHILWATADERVIYFSIYFSNL